MIGRIVRLALIALLVAVGVHLWYGRVAERLQARLPASSPAAACIASRASFSSSGRHTVSL